MAEENNQDPFKKYIDPDTGKIRQDLQVNIADIEKKYLADNPDVAAIAGNRPGAGIEHYLEFGKKEGREASSELKNLDKLDYKALTSNFDDPNLGEDVRDRMLKGLETRDLGRTTGYKGIYTGLEGGESYDAFKTSVGSKERYTDEYGKKTPIGEYAELAKNPTLTKGTLDEDKYLEQNPDVAAAIARGDFKSAQDHYDRFGKLEGREAPLTGGTELNLETVKIDEEKELLDPTDYKLKPDEFQAETETVQAKTATPVTKTLAQSFMADEQYKEVAKEAVKAASKQGLTDIIQAQQGQVDADSTVQGQLSKLMLQFEDGKIPPFAAGAIRTAEQRLAARGMGTSSMAGDAILQAAMEAATPIAAADAATYRSMNEKNLDNRQQAEVLNAQMMLQLDLANLDNEQKTRIFNTGNRIQSLFNDQAAVNSAKQFNASSAQQNDQFFANLFQTTAQFNANQQNAVAMNNAGREDATSQFNKKLADNRDQTYKRNSIVIDQANAVYRRQINTANTALKNAETEYNTSQRFNVQQNAKNNLLQDFKDQEYFARTLARDDKEFQNSLALSNFAFDQNIKASADIAKGRIVGGVLTSAANAVFEDIFSPTKSKPKEV